MRIKHETIKLTGRQTFRSWRKAFIENNKLKFLGDGAFATAYTKNKKTGRLVYKIGVADLGFKHDWYLKYLQQIVLKNQRNPLMPKIKSVRFLKIQGKGRYDTTAAYIIEMERLYDYETVADKVGDRIVRRALWPYGLLSYDDLDYGAIMGSADVDTTGWLRKIAAPLNKMLRWHGDCHDGNYMWRLRKGKLPQIVITDPVA